MLFEQNPTPMWVYDVASLAFLAVNDAAVQHYGYTRDEFLRLTIRDIRPAHEVPALLAAVAAVQSRTPFAGSWRHRRKDGSLFDVEVLSQPVQWEGRPARLVVATDVSGRRRVEQTLRVLLDHIEEGYYEVDRAGRFTCFNAELARLLGYEPHELEGMSYREYLDADTAREVYDTFHAVFASGAANKAYAWEVIRKDGVRLAVEASIVPKRAGDEIVGFFGIVRDITDRRRVEQALRESESKYRLLMDQASDAILVCDAHGRYLAVNPRACRLLGYTEGELLALTVHDLIPADDLARTPLRFDDLRAGRTVLIERRLRRKDGLLIPVEISARMLEDGRMHAVVRDISSRKRAEDALRESEAHYRSLVDNAPFGIYRTSVEGGFVAVNPALVTMLGYASADELLAADLAADIYADPAERSRLIAQYRETPTIRNAEVVWKRRDGSRIMVRLNGRGVQGPGGEVEGFEVLVEDVTERRGLEDQLRQAQKMEAVGRLAGGVAHDFGNLITAIIGYSDLLLRGLKGDAARQSDVMEIKNTALRASTLVRQLLAYSRRQVLTPQVLDLHTTVSDLGSLLHRLIGEHIQLVTHTTPGLGAVRADPGQIEQVLMNLAVNARDAMPHGGTLTIETSNADLDESYARRHPIVTAGAYVLLAVSDTGVGMDEHTRAHLFEPFFTTKPQGQGTGLGLATVYGIVKQSGGFVWVYSEPGLGTTFKIYLPRLTRDGAAPGAPPPAPPVARGTETVLIAEDEPAVRAIACTALRDSGYRVLGAASGIEALGLLDQWGVDLLVTDVVMPKMNGQELADLVRARRPDLPILFMSGYTSSASGAILDGGTLRPGAAFLQKPFTPEALSRKVRDILDRR